MEQEKIMDHSEPHNNRLRLSGVERQSIVDGPGIRYAVFTQGCPHGCLGCHNPQTHDFSAGYDESADTLLAEFDANPLLKGMTFSGGEPFSQASALLPLARGVRDRGKDLYCYSGYTFEELLGLSRENRAIAELLSLIDVLIDGRFVLGLRDLALRFRGSSNQRVLDVKASLAAGKAVEAVLPE